MSINQMFLISSFRYLVYNFCDFRCIFPALENYYSIWMSTFFCSSYILSTIRWSFNKSSRKLFWAFLNNGVVYILDFFSHTEVFEKLSVNLEKISRTLKKLLMNKQWFDDLNFQIKICVMSVNFERLIIWSFSL
jgi:hypothetical protein